MSDKMIWKPFIIAAIVGVLALVGLAAYDMSTNGTQDKGEIECIHVGSNPCVPVTK